MIDRLVDAGAPVHTCCRILGVSRQGYYRYRKRPTSSTELRRRWLTGLIREIHVASRGTYGYRRIHAELTIGMGIPCSSRLISALMTRASIGGLPGPARIKRLRGVATADDLVNRKFHLLALNELWVTDITEHPTREGKVYCAAVLDACSRKIIGWAIDSKQDSTLVINALDMAIRARKPGAGGIVHADHGVQFTSWVFTQKIRSAGLLPSFGTVGDGLDNAMMEMLLSESRGHRGCFEDAKHVAGVVALETAHRLALGLALGDPAGEVGLGGWMNLGADQHGLVQGAVELTIPAARKPVAGLGLPRGCLQRSGTGQTGEGGFAAAAPGVGPGNQDLGGEQGADAGFLQEAGRHGLDQRQHGSFEFFAFAGQLRDAHSRAAQ